MKKKIKFNNPKLTDLEVKKVELKYSKDTLVKILVAVIRDAATLDKVRINALRNLYKYDRTTAVSELNAMMEEALSSNDRGNVAALLLKAYDIEGGIDDDE